MPRGRGTIISWRSERGGMLPEWSAGDGRWERVGKGGPLVPGIRGGAGDQRREALAPLPASPFPAIGPIDLPLAGRSDGSLAPGFRVWCGRLGATPGITRGSPVHSVRCPNARNARRFLAGFDTCQIRQRLPALGQVLPNLRAAGIAPQPLALRPGLNPESPSANRTDQSATGRLLRWSSGSRPSRA